MIQSLGSDASIGIPATPDDLTERAERYGTNRKIPKRTKSVCDMIKEKGLLVASVVPPVIIHCGMVNWRNLPAADIGEIQTVKSQRPEIIFL